MMLTVCFLFLALTVGQTTPPIVIAHRGASGYLPEHTLEAKALAHSMGADFLEQDLVLSQDNVPVVLHDIHIDTVTDVVSRFPNRKRDDGRYYAFDFTVAELKQLRVTERINVKTGKAVYPGRFPAGKSSFQISTLEEELEFIAGLNKSAKRVVGIYPEIKQPAWHRKQGRDLSKTVLSILERHGYRSKTDPCWLQCFEYEEIKRIRNELGWQGKLVQLMGAGASPARLAELAKVVDGIGPSLGSVISDQGVTSLVKNAHAQGLVVHPYTIRTDDLPKSVKTVDELHRLILIEAGADGVFTDFVDQTSSFVKTHR